jgi:hypothetical protein
VDHVLTCYPEQSAKPGGFFDPQEPIIPSTYSIVNDLGFDVIQEGLAILRERELPHHQRPVFDSCCMAYGSAAEMLDHDWASLVRCLEITM